MYDLAEVALSSQDFSSTGLANGVQGGDNCASGVSRQSEKAGIGTVKKSPGRFCPGCNQL